MAQREHFTNARCQWFATGLFLMGASFGAQVSNWNHWITIGFGYGSGLVLLLAATVFICKSYFAPETTDRRRKPAVLAQNSGIIPGIPTLSGLFGQNPAV